MRKELDVTITAEGRDHGKKFHLTELSASRAEKWAARALLALLKSGVELPDGVAELGMAGVAAMGLQALGGITWELAEPLLAEMMECITVCPSDRDPGFQRKLVEEDIEEVATRLYLRKLVFELHVGFSLTAKLQSLKTSTAAGASSTNTQAASTSPEASAT